MRSACRRRIADHHCRRQIAATRKRSTVPVTGRVQSPQTAMGRACMMPGHGAHRRGRAESRSILPCCAVMGSSNALGLPSHCWPPEPVVLRAAEAQKTAGEPAVALLCNLTLLLGLWQLMDLVSCHIDLHSVADAIEFPIGNNDHVAAETEKATDLEPDRRDFPAGRHCYTVNGAKVG